MLSLNLPEGVLSELLYADDLVLMSETIEGLKNRFIKWKEAFDSMVLKVNLGKTKNHHERWHVFPPSSFFVQDAPRIQQIQFLISTEFEEIED